jgi:hypothetical protein
MRGSEPVLGVYSRAADREQTDGMHKRQVFRVRTSDTEPEPNGLEGLADVRIINALLESKKNDGP